MKKLIYILLIATAFTSCNTEETFTKSDIKGNWEYKDNAVNISIDFNQFKAVYTHNDSEFKCDYKLQDSRGMLIGDNWSINFELYETEFGSLKLKFGEYILDKVE